MVTHTPKSPDGAFASAVRATVEGAQAPRQATTLNARVMVLATGAYACLSEGARTLDVRLNPGRKASVALAEYVASERERAAAILARAAFAERGAAQLAERGQ